MGAEKNAAIQRRFALVQKQMSRANIVSYAETSQVLSQLGIDMVKLGCTLPNLANICLHNSNCANFYPLTESDKDLLSKVRENMVGRPSVVLRRKTVINETHIRKSTKVCKMIVCKMIVGIDASQLYPSSFCQPMPKGLYKRYEFDAELQRIKPRQSKNRSFKNEVKS